MSQDHSVQKISLTPLEISAFVRYLARHHPTEEELRAYFAALPERTDPWFAMRRFGA